MSKHENSNQFKEGLLMDLHPLQTPNTVLTDNLNGTFITYNGNEYSLQNDMGNFKLKNCKLKPGYLPVGTASYADTIYILSYNPIENNVELGSYPAPVEYNDSSKTKHRQILSVIENYIISNFDSQDLQNKLNQTKIIDILQSDAKNYIKEIIFDEEDLQLKRGDSYSLNQDGGELCGFEKLKYSTILESGKEVEINPNINTEGPVTWDSPGNIKVSNKLFEIEQSSHRITSVHIFNEKVEITVLYEIFISDKDFVDKLKRGEILISKDSTSKDRIVFNTSIKSENSTQIYNGEIKKLNLNSWLGDCLKIECLVKFSLPRNENDTAVKAKYTIQPEFHTSINLNEGTSIVKINFIQDTHRVKDENFDLENLSTEEIGNKLFSWDDNNIYANIVNISDLKPYYKVRVYTDNNFEDLEWTEASISNENIEISINEGWKNKFIVISFCQREILDKPALVETKIDGYSPYSDGSETKYYNPNEYEQLIIKVDNEPDITKYIKIDNNPQTSKAIFLYDSSKMLTLWDTYCSKILTDNNESNNWLANTKRYDLISFEDIYKNHVSTGLKLNCTIKDIDYLTLHDEGAKEGEFYHYFKRFNDESIYYPSIVSKAPKSNISDHCFEIPKAIEITCNIEGSNNISKLGNIEVDTIKDELSIVYNDRKDLETRTKVTRAFSQNVIFKHSSDEPVQLWNKINCSVKQKGDSFYFSDKLNFYQMKSPKSEFRFDAVTLDQDGNGKNDFTVNCTIKGQYYQWKSLDIQNYRAIRMGYPETAWEVNSESGCKQMDFSGTGASLQSFDKRKLSGMCNYMGNFHKLVRIKLDNLETPTIKKDGASYEGECEDTETYSHVKCIATTFYRDKAQRPSFTNESSSINVVPDWEKWKDGEGNKQTEHHSAEKTFLAFPMYCTKDAKHLIDKRIEPKWDRQTAYTNMVMSYDREYWTKVSGSEQHSTPEVLSCNNPFEGIGFVSTNNPNPGWYVAWIPDWETLDESEQKFKRCTQTEVEHNPQWIYNQTSAPEWSGRCSIFTKIPDSVINICKKIKDTFDIESDNLPIEPPLIEVVGQDIWNTWELPEGYFTKIETHCNNDLNNLKSHPIYKSFINAGSSVSDRIKNWPASGVYPDIQDIRTTDFFDSVEKNLVPWRNIYVDGKGRPFLVNSDPKENIYICKNSKKQIFGYFPHIDASK